MLSPSEYATKLANDLTKITMTDFFKAVHSQFYPDQDISFMEYFLELCDHEGEFIVHHSKLVEYGIMTSDRSNDIKKKLDQLMIIECSDYLLRDISQNSQNGGRPSKVYCLTPEAFKKCLMRARRYKGQSVDPIIYCDYYLLLEKVHKLYIDYERLYSNKLLSIKDDKIDKQSKKIDELLSDVKDLKSTNANQSKEIAELKLMNVDQSRNIDRLIGHAEGLDKKIDTIFGFMLSFARMTIPMWIGSHVMKTQFDNLLESNTLDFSLHHLKVMFVVSFYEVCEKTPTTIGDKTLNIRSKMKTYFCCTNFADVGDRIRLLVDRHCDLYMLKPQAICLISCEINTERVILSRMGIFPDDSFVNYSHKHKSYDVQLITKHLHKIEAIYYKIVENCRKERFQSYQIRMDEYNKTRPIKSDILECINKADDTFFNSTLPFCQQFIDCYVKESLDKDGDFIDWTYMAATRKMKKRADLQNIKLSDRRYQLHKIKQLIEEHNANDKIEEMVQSGIISKKDIESLRAIADIENVDISGVDFPSDSSDEEN